MAFRTIQVKFAARCRGGNGAHGGPERVDARGDGGGGRLGDHLTDRRNRATRPGRPGVPNRGLMSLGRPREERWRH